MRFSRVSRWVVFWGMMAAFGVDLRAQSPAPQASPDAKAGDLQTKTPVTQTNTDATAVAPAAKPTPPAPELTVEPAVVFGKGGGQELHAQVAYLKKRPRLMPAVIFIHGGGWSSGTYKSLWMLQLASEGYFTASIGYRSSKEAKWPAQLEDCKLAVRWLRAKAARYHVDPDRIGVWGMDSGGHLAACLGTMADEKQYEGNGGYADQSSAVQAVVDFYGPVDFTRPEAYQQQEVRAIEALLGVPHAKDPGLWESASPLHHVKAGDPPMLLVHGDADNLVPLEQSKAFGEALEKAGVPHQLIVVKNGGHSLAPLEGTKTEPDASEVRRKVKEFFDKELKRKK